VLVGTLIPLLIILTEKAISVKCNIKWKNKRFLFKILQFSFRIIHYNNYLEQDTVSVNDVILSG
jgi:hypothetical protein